MPHSNLRGTLLPDFLPERQDGNGQPIRIGADKKTQKPWRMILDPSQIYERGVEFCQSDVAGTLYVGCWPIGIIFRDYNDLEWEVVQDGEQQVLVSRDGRKFKALSSLGFQEI